MVPDLEGNGGSKMAVLFRLLSRPTRALSSAKLVPRPHLTFTCRFHSSTIMASEAAGHYAQQPVASSTAHQGKLATIDLSQYDPEQSKLMDERCIVVDENDVVLGALDKKTCKPETTRHSIF